MRVLLLQHEGNLHIDLVALDVAVLYKDVLILNPATLHAPKRLGGTGDSLVYGVLEARLRGGAQLGHSGNTHTYLCLLYGLGRLSNMWPEDEQAKHKDR